MKSFQCCELSILVIPVRVYQRSDLFTYIASLISQNMYHTASTWKYSISSQINLKLLWMSHISHYCQYGWVESLILFEPTGIDSCKQCCKPHKIQGSQTLLAMKLSKLCEFCMFPFCHCKWVGPQSRSNPFIVAVEVDAKYTHISHYCQYKWAESLKLFEPTFTDSYK